MQLFIRDSRTLAFDVEEDVTINDLKRLFTSRSFGIEAPDSWVLLHNGHQLPSETHLSSTSITSGATLTAVGRLRGGGGDGGSTGAESRSCYLEMYRTKVADKMDPKEELLARWTSCHLSGERLAPPCVADELGALYNKEAVVHALLHKALPTQLAHISSLKSLVNIRLEPSASKQQQRQEVQFQCPVSGQEMNGRAKFVIHRPTGWIISEKALKEAPAAVEETLGCKWASGDLIPVNPSGEELQELRVNLAKKLAAEREKKALKKAKKNGVVTVAGPATAGEAAAAAAPAPAGTAGAKDGSPKGGAVGVKRVTAEVAEPVPVAAAVAAKKLKLPEGATPEVYASIFGSKEKDKQRKETYCCRSVSGRTYV